MKSKRAAMEMSVGTIVTIVLLMSVLILGIFLVKNIFSSAGGAIDAVDDQVQSEINKLFGEEGRKLAVYPTSQQITLKAGDDPKGFAFSVKNNDVEESTFSFTLESSDVSKCGSTMSKAKANNFISANFVIGSIGPGDTRNKIVLFNLPESTPPCLMTYLLEIQKDESAYEGADIFVTIK